MRKMIRSTIQLVEGGYLASVPGFLHWLPSVAPCYPVRGEQVAVIKTPQEFYNTIIERCSQAKSRILLASLYLGTGHRERQLVEALSQRLAEENELQISILVDANRGSRGQVNSRVMLLPLLQNWDSQCHVSLFHTPSLRAPLKHILPPRYNELVGLQHMKIYLFDDSVLISGANLSEDYFTNRQDRYILIKDCKGLADFYWKLADHVSSVSLSLDKENHLKPKREKFAGENIENFYHSERNREIEDMSEADTWLFPLIELPPFNIHIDTVSTERLLKSIPPGSRVTMSTGYFNLTQRYSTTILSCQGVDFEILMAHPKANGFLNAKGLAGGIPAAYTGLATKFLDQVQNLGLSHGVHLWEFEREGWTYHAKGLWLREQSNSPTLLTLVGSSNFGERSASRDLESQLTIVTRNAGLSRQLDQEQNSLMTHCSPFTRDTAQLPERIPPLWVHLFIRFFKTYF